MNLAALFPNPPVLITPFFLRHPAEFIVLAFIIFIIIIIIRRLVKVKR